MSGLAALAAALVLSACGTTGTNTTPAPIVQSQATPVAPPVRGGKDGLTPSFMQGRTINRVGLLLPFSAFRAESEALLNAAELALFQNGDATTLLLPRDSGVTPADTERAARQLTRDGVDVILGPLLRETVPATAQAARSARVPVIAFSSDRGVAGNGVYLMTFTVEDEVARVTRYAVSRGLRTFAFLGRDDEYARRAAGALQEAAAQAGGTVSLIRFYPRNERAAADAARALAAEARAIGVQAVLIADSGTVLRAAAPALLQGGLEFKRVRLLGTSEWLGPDLQREPTLAGGWFPAADPTARGQFDAAYRAAYGKAPPRIASNAFDAMSLAAHLSRSPAGIVNARIEAREGYFGADGLYRFTSNGTVERSLAIMEVRPGGPAVIDAAPQRFAPPGT